MNRRDDQEYAAIFDKVKFTLQYNLLRQDVTGHPMFICIVGDSGAGKSTLAKIIRDGVTSEMQVIVWYHMEPGSSTADLLADLYHRAVIQCIADEQQEDEMIICYDFGDKLRHLLANKRYLLILSGISSVRVLKSLRASLPDSENGGRVMLILDTENAYIADHANAINNGIDGIHEIARLNDLLSARLLFWKLSRTGQQEGSNLTTDEPHRITGIVHRITGGLPMAIVLLAGLLRYKKPDKWDEVLQELSHATPQSQEAYWMRPEPGPSMQRSNQLCREIELIFWASFEDLPNELKSCFLYLASCHKNISHPADKIMRMWIAEGFIDPQREGTTMEELGHDYLNELVTRCLVEVEENKVGGGIQLFRVHNRTMGLLQTEASESGFMDNFTVPPLARRLSVQSVNGRQFTSTFANRKFPKLRSFICHIVVKHQQHKHDLKFLHRSKFLRVISIEGLNLAKLPDTIGGDMINLRYLRIDCSSLCKLPSSIARLLNLQTLDISNTQVEEIDNDFWKIKTLRHVLATNLSLPERMPLMGEEDEAGGGSELQTLHGVKPAAKGEWNAGECPLDKMTNLLSLEMHGFEDARHGRPAFEAALGNMNLLGHLKLQGDEIPTCVFTDPSLRSLQTMVLQGNVNWNIVPVDRLLRQVRPNLVQLKLNYQANDGITGSIREQLREVLIRED